MVLSHRMSPGNQPEQRKIAVHVRNYDIRAVLNRAYV